MACAAGRHIRRALVCCNARQDILEGRWGRALGRGWEIDVEADARGQDGSAASQEDLAEAHNER